MKDFEGTEIKVGDRVIYAQLLGRSAGLNRGVVTAFKTMEPYYMSPREKVQVRIEVTDWKHQNGRKTKPKLVWLSFPERIIVSKKE